MAIWYILCFFGLFFPFWYFVPWKIWQPCQCCLLATLIINLRWLHADTNGCRLKLAWQTPTTGNNTFDTNMDVPTCRRFSLSSTTQHSSI
jgi:hypothetical protein